MNPIISNIQKDICVAHILSPYQIVLNVGSINGVSIGDEFIIYGLSQEPIRDPYTGEDLGYLELYRGVGVVSYLQDTMSILTAKSSNVLGQLLVSGHFDNEFNNPQVGDFAKPNATKIQST